MIDFRYHLVSIVAVFLALALGVVFGAVAIKPSALSTLQNGYVHEQHQIDQLIASGRISRQQLAADEAFALSAAPQLLAHLLDGQRVVIVAAPGAPGSVTSGVTRALTEAGATVSGQVQLQAHLLDPAAATQQALSQLAQRVAPPGMTLTGGTAMQRAGRVLASAILTGGGPNQPVPGQPDSTGRSVLAGLASAGFVSVSSGNPAARATLAVVVIPASPPAVSDANPASNYLVTVAQQLGLAGHGTVVAGTVPGSVTGSAIDVMRANNRRAHLSSVDNADMVSGQITVVQALYEQLQGVSGDYGIAGTDGAAPTPAPTPSATGSGAATQTGRARAAATPSAAGRP
ncbi:MAG: copper transporter [Gemmatimonadota bacterium]